MSNARPAAPLHDNPSALSSPAHPVGLLYTLLRHGRGLGHEEAARLSRIAIGGAPGVET